MKFDVRLSKEAGVYVKDIVIEAKDEDEAKSKALKTCENKDHESWTYTEGGWYDALIQVEDVTEQ